MVLSCLSNICCSFRNDDPFTLCLGFDASSPRSISEVLYQLGLAQALAAKYKEAEASMDNAIKVLQRRIENLKKMGESENIAKEIKDMEALIDEIKEKIEDHKNMEKGIYVEKTSGFPGKPCT